MKMLFLKFVKAFLRYISLLIMLIISCILLLQINLLQSKVIKINTWKVSGKYNDSPDMKYVLIWSKGIGVEWNILKEKRSVFKEKKCEFNNCYITKNRNYLNNDYSNFDAVVIDGKGIVENINSSLPKRKNLKQLYVFTTKESAANYPVCDPKFDSYFNVTWTYRLDSDIPWTYFSIYNSRKRKIGPKNDMTWPQDLNEENDIVEIITAEKKFAAIWIASNCYTNSEREKFVQKIKIALSKYDLTLEIFGKCEGTPCSPDLEDNCMRNLHKYFFYLAFENSFAEDYVTEKVATAFGHYMVPIVLGGANYSRFLPPNSYINAGNLTADETATMMDYLIKNKSEYLKYLSWRDHYTYIEEDFSSCQLCKLLNEGFEKEYKYFRDWWNPTNFKSYINEPELRIC